jgi:hypothetical protein
MYRFVDDNELQTVDMGDGDWIKIPAKLSYGFVSKFGDMKKEVAPGDVGKVLGFLVGLVKEWNFKMNKEGDEIAPITEEYLNMLDIGTLNAMVAAITPLMTVEKKDSAA